MAKYVAPGEIIQHTPGSALAAGDVVVIGTIVGVATQPVAASALGSVAVSGVWAMPKGAESITAGASGNYYAASGIVTAASTGVACGKAVAAAVTGAATVDVRIG